MNTEILSAKNITEGDLASYILKNFMYNEPGMVTPSGKSGSSNNSDNDSDVDDNQNDSVNNDSDKDNKGTKGSDQKNSNKEPVIKNVSVDNLENLKSEVVNAVEYAKKHNNENGIIDLNHIDVSDIQDMSNLFKDDKHNYDISKWNVSKVKTFESAFENSNFNNDISKWNVSNAVSMKNMFKNNKFFKQKDLNSWNVSKVKDFSGMFEGSVFNGKISKWKFGPHEIDMSSMFKNNKKFNKSVISWNLSNAKTTDMFNGSEKFQGISGKIFKLGDPEKYGINIYKKDNKNKLNSIDANVKNIDKSIINMTIGKIGTNSVEPALSKASHMFKNSAVDKRFTDTWYINSKNKSKDIEDRNTVSKTLFENGLPYNLHYGLFNDVKEMKIVDLYEYAKPDYIEMSLRDYIKLNESKLNEALPTQSKSKRKIQSQDDKSDNNIDFDKIKITDKPYEFKALSPYYGGSEYSKFGKILSDKVIDILSSSVKQSSFGYSWNRKSTVDAIERLLTGDKGTIFNKRYDALEEITNNYLGDYTLIDSKLFKNWYENMIKYFGGEPYSDKKMNDEVSDRLGPSTLTKFYNKVAKHFGHEIKSNSPKADPNRAKENALYVQAIKLYINYANLNNYKLLNKSNYPNLKKYWNIVTLDNKKNNSYVIFKRDERKHTAKIVGAINFDGICDMVLNFANRKKLKDKHVIVN